MLKIYVQNKPLLLVDKVDKTVQDYMHRPDVIFIDELNAPAIKTMLQQLEQEDFYGGVFLHSDLQQLLEGFKARLMLIQAAGGLVYTKQKEILLIFRKGKWDLPKGKLDEGEDLESCAVREVMEETGAGHLVLEKPLAVTYHTYHEKGKHILKESHWFLIKAKKRSDLKPQTEEDITECRWVSISEIDSYKDLMHASLIDVVDEAQKFLNH